VWATVTRQPSTLVEPGATEPQLRGKELNHVPRVTAKGGVDVTPAPRTTVSVWTDVQTDYFLTTANAEGKFGDRRLVHVDAVFRAHPSLTTCWRDAYRGSHSRLDAEASSPSSPTVARLRHHRSKSPERVLVVTRLGTKRSTPANRRQDRGRLC
jgi:hypothetical protein